MKEYICKKDYYLGAEKFASVGDHILLLDDNATVVNTNSEKKKVNMPEIVNDFNYFCPTFEINDVKVVEDNVDHPKHYNNGDIECIDAMVAAYGIEEVMSFCKCNAFKYLWRFDNKNGIEDIKKAQWYQNKYIKLANKCKHD